MKKQILSILMLIIAVVFFTSCEKEKLDTVETKNMDLEKAEPAAIIAKDTLIDNAIQAIDLAKVAQIDSGSFDMSNKVETRSVGRQLVQQLDITLNQGQWSLRYYHKSQLRPGYRYIARVIRQYGDPDLYMHGRKRSGEYRVISSSRGPGAFLEEASATLNHLQSDEDWLYFSVYAQTNTRFYLQIFIEPICTTSGCLAGTYYIRSALGTYLDVQWANRASGTNVWAYEYTGTGAQGWTLIDAGNQYYYIKSDLGTYLDVTWANPASGTNVWAYNFTGTAAQKWYVNQLGDGTFIIVSALGTWLDVTWANPASGTNVWAYRFTGTNAQKWQLLQR